MKPDLLICWIKHCDYPLFRRWLKDHRDFFGKIVIYWSEHFRDNYFDKFMQEDLEKLGNIQFLENIDYQYGVEDWRNVATTYMLKQTNSEWVCSVEQDFFARDWDKLLEAVEEASKTYDVIGYKGYQGQAEHQSSYLTGNYCHPAFWFMKRTALEKTSKNFSADTTKGCDHFGLITQDCEKLDIPIWYTQDHGFSEDEAFHQGGINQNYINGLTDPNFVFHRPEDFYIYNYYSLKVDVPQDPQFMEIMEKMDEKLKAIFPEIDPKTDSRKTFYDQV